MPTFAIGDIHGRIEALREVLSKSGFDYDSDTLIVLGDIVDGGYNTYEVVEELLRIKNLIFIIGNHDVWFMNHIRSGWAEDIWLLQGGSNTLASYKKFNYDYGNMPVTHQEFFNRGVFYHIDSKNRLFVHGGFDTRFPIDKQTSHVLTWDRYLIERCLNGLKIKDFERVFVGHTPTQTYDSDVPVRFGRLVMLDTGGGWNGFLTIMNIDSEKFWQSQRQIPAR